MRMLYWSAIGCQPSSRRSNRHPNRDREGSSHGPAGPTKGDEDATSPLSDREFSENPESGMARSALLLLNSGSWILNSSVRWGVFNGVGAFPRFFPDSQTLRESVLGDH